MGIERAPHNLKDNPIRQRAVPDQEDNLPERVDAEHAGDLVALQRRIGNSGMQRLLARGELHHPQHTGDVIALQRGIGNSAVQRLLAQGRILHAGPVHPLQRESDCEDCGGDHVEQDELPEAAITGGNPVQRFWDDDEEEESSDEEGGGFTDWVGDTVSEIGETVEGWFDSSEDESRESETEAGGAQESDETESEGGTGGLVEWESGDTGAPQDIPDVSAECATEEGVGFGGGVSVRLHGRTDANYNHGRPIPAPFPSSITVTTRPGAFSAHGTFQATFAAHPNVTLPPVPGGLSECQQEAVRNFINGPLAAHEQDHVSAFTSNYDGTVTLSVDHDNIADTPANRQNAMNNPVAAEDVTRTQTANDASAALDPWNRDIPGLDCDE